MTTLRTFSAALLTVVCTIAISACGAADQIQQASKVANAGIATGEYLKQAKPALDEFSATVSPLAPGPKASADQTQKFQDAASRLSDVESKLKALSPSGDYKKANNDLISAVHAVQQDVSHLGDACATMDQTAYEAAIKSYATDTSAFAAALQEATVPVTNAAK